MTLLNRLCSIKGKIYLANLRFESFRSEFKAQCYVFLHVLDVSFPIISGYSSRSKDIIFAQKQIGMRPLALTSPHHPYNGDIEWCDGIEYFRTCIPNRSRLFDIHGNYEIRFVNAVHRRILDVVKANNVNIIHAHSPSLLGLAAIWASKKMGLKVVYEIRAFWEDAAVASGKYQEHSFKYKLVKNLETFVCKHVPRIVTISQAMKNDLVFRGIPAKKVFVVPNGIDLGILNKPVQDSSLASRLGLVGKTVFGYLGTFYDFEGISDLIEAIVKLHETEKEAVLLLVGGGERESSIIKRLMDLDVDYIIFVGKVPHEMVVEYYKIMDVIVYPRKSTKVTELTTPLKPLEAMALGKPVICSAVGGLVELVGSDNGLFFTPGNLDALVDICRYFLRNFSSLKKLAKRGEERAIKERRWDRIVKEYESVYALA